MAKNRKAKLAKRAKRQEAEAELKTRTEQEAKADAEIAADDDGMGEGPEAIAAEMDAVIASLTSRNVEDLKVPTAAPEQPKRKPPTPGAVIYLGRIPFGFFEREMHGYFSQFGKVVRLRLSRNPKTHKSRHYAFVELETPDVAKVVVDAMHGYMMYGRTLVCQIVPESKIHDKLFAGAWHPGKHYTNSVVRSKPAHNARDHESHKRRVENLVASNDLKRRKLAAAHIDFEFVGYSTAAVQQ
ncbi:RRM domain-containing protein [Plasmodiophora brassicae]|uniref:RRM domain-containing protein n=1 Tax=Plasmodiophora brassicae TaxID=37360 RepID=A0A0G4IMA4_PLABS|nr:hypothetical protein PBRA_004901 [Plasmodiophora brassicae]SPQ99165.1 unnamed protein product [Plasmodiophora brassicae]